MLCLQSKTIGAVLVAAASALAWTRSAVAAQNRNPEPASAVQKSKGICGLTDVEALPFLKRGVQLNYTGSMAKDGGNADNAWWLYQDPATAEWVIFDVDGPGCIHQVYNHRGYPGYRGAPENKTVSEYNAPDTVYRFYFDGADKPQFTIKASEFGSLAGFEAPLTDMYLNWVKRTWFPMFFRKGCKITTSVRLETPPGGWGTVVYHSYATPDGVPTFQEFLPRLPDVKQTLATPRGQDPKPTDGNVRHTADVTLSPGGKQTLLDTQGCASIASCTLKLEPYNPDALQMIHVRLFFDDMNKPCVDVPFGAFFGNVRGTTNTLMVMQGLEISKDGDAFKSARGYNFFPMPFWKAARIEVTAATNLFSDVKIAAEIATRPSEKTAYPKAQCGTFRAAYREPYTPTGGEDTEYASIRGTGHLVSCTFASRATCEEDFRFYVDGCGTAKIESDGAESWGGFGWGFCGSYSGPLTCQDHRNGWTQTRDMLGECYPFYSRIDVRQENLWHDVSWGWWHYQPGKTRDYHGAVFYYGIDQPTLVQTDTLDVGNVDSERMHTYRSDGTPVSLTARYEGCTFEDKQYSGGFVPGEVTDTGRAVKTASEFTVAIRPDNAGVRLRRRSDQTFGRQRAQVFVDGEPITERTWYRADRNPHLRWLEDEFEIPAHYTKGKDKIRVRLVFLPTELHLPPPGDPPVPALPAPCLTQGRFGQALQGGAFQQTLTCLLNAPKPEYTVDFWVRFPEHKPGVQHILLWSGFWDILTDNGYVVVRTDPKLGRNIREAKSGKDTWSNVQHTATDAMIADGNWHHLALSENGHRLCLFVDGKRILDAAVERKQPFARGGRFTVGYRDANTPFGGALDELRFSSVFRDTVTVSSSPTVPDADTFALWNFDQTIAHDRIGNAVTTAPALVVGAKAPVFMPNEMDTPATAWSEFYYWVFSYVPRP